MIHSYPWNPFNPWDSVKSCVSSPGYRNPDDGGRAGGILGAWTWRCGGVRSHGSPPKIILWLWLFVVNISFFSEIGKPHQQEHHQNVLCSRNLENNESFFPSQSFAEAPDLDFRKFAEERVMSPWFGSVFYPSISWRSCSTQTQVICSIPNAACMVYS